MKEVLLITIVILSCKPGNHCERKIEKLNGVEIGFMIHGQLFSKSPGIVSVSIVKFNNPKDWSHNEYFTGYDFSYAEEQEMLVPQKDSCKLKKMYFKYLDGLK